MLLSHFLERVKVTTPFVEPDGIAGALVNDERLAAYSKLLLCGDKCAMSI